MHAVHLALRRARRWLMVPAILVGLCLPAFSLPTRATFDPLDEMYRQIDLWQARGVLTNLPSLRPYPVDMLRKILTEAAAAGSVDDSRMARSFLQALGTTSLGPAATMEARLRDSTYYGAYSPGAEAMAAIGDAVMVSGRLNFWLLDGSDSPVEPPGERHATDTTADPAAVTLSVAGRSLYVSLESASVASLGDGTVSVQAGLNRSSFGPFFADGVVIGPQASATGNFVFCWRPESLTVTEGFFSLIQGAPGSFTSGKYLILHDLRWQMTDWLRIGYFETVVWTGRIEPLYFLPVTNLFYQQGLTGFLDNSFAGLTASVRLPYSVGCDLLMYSDDLFKWAAQAGVTWSPGLQWLGTMSLSYTLVLPYTYTHDTSQYAYTNWGANLGPALEPNSDRIQLEATLNPADGLALDVQARMVRHGNASEGYTTGDGSISDPGFGAGGATFVTHISQLLAGKSLRFLTQSVIDTSLQAGLGARLTLPLGFGALRLSAGYLLELRFNEGLVSGANGVHHYMNAGVLFSM
jgi:hypothetical protein